MVESESFEDYDLRLIDWYDEIEDSIADCMKAAGFEYYPEYVDQAEREAILDSAATDVESEGPQRLIPPEDSTYYQQERELRSKIGFGMFFSEAETSLAASSVYENGQPVGGADDSSAIEVDTPVDPMVERNRQYVLSLDELARAEYWATLYGDEEDGTEVSSCSARARQDVGDIPVRQNFDLARHLEAEDRIVALVDSSPEVVDGQSQYTRCMGEEGYDTADSLDAYSQFGAFVQATIAKLSDDGVDLGPLHESGDWNAVMPKDELALLRQEEIEFALLDWDCAEQVRLNRESATARIEKEVLTTEYPDVAIDLGIDVND